MADRSIIFQPAMVNAILAGRKTQTRRLLPSHLELVELGDLLWVREALYNPGIGLTWQRRYHYRADSKPSPVWNDKGTKPKLLPSIHMPRIASRLTLVITRTVIERLHSIDDDDAQAEGVCWQREPWPGWPSGWLVPGLRESFVATSEGPRAAFAALWKHTHGAEAWERNPEVVVLTFLVRHEAIEVPEVKQEGERYGGM